MRNEDKLDIAIADFRIAVLKLGKVMAADKCGKRHYIKQAVKRFNRINTFTAQFTKEYSPAAERAMINLVKGEVAEYKLSDSMLGKILCIDSDMQSYNGTQLMGFVAYFADKYDIKLDF